MTEGYAYFGNNKKMPCEFHNWLVDHPEVKAVRLKWTWNIPLPDCVLRPSSS